MITYENSSSRPSAFKSMFGLSLSAFEAFYPEFEAAHTLRLQQSDLNRRGEKRKHKPGAGRTFHHSLKERLLLALMWLRVYPTLELLGFFFSLDKTAAEDNLKDILRTLESMASFSLDYPDKNNRKKIRTLDQMRDAFPDVVLVIDAKEQRIQRPKKAPAEPETEEEPPSDTQKPYYSGKKKCHTLKTQFGIRPDGYIEAVSESVGGGANHDLTLLRKSALLDHLGAGEAAMMDKGYDGIQKEYPHQKLYLPHKARRGHPLTEEQKAYNRHLSSYRIVVEHTMAQLNVFSVLAQVYRHSLKSHNRIIRIVASLVNIRIARTPLKTYHTA